MRVARARRIIGPSSVHIFFIYSKRGRPTALYCAHRPSTFRSCAVCEQREQSACPASLFPTHRLVPLLCQTAIHEVHIAPTGRRPPEESAQQPHRGAAGGADRRPSARCADDRPSDCPAGGTDRSTANGVSRHLAAFPCAWTRAGGFGDLAAIGNVLLREVGADRLIMCVRIEDRLGAGAGGEQKSNATD